MNNPDDELRFSIPLTAEQVELLSDDDARAFVEAEMSRRISARIMEMVREDAAEWERTILYGNPDAKPPRGLLCQ